MQKRFAPSFVITASALCAACHKAPSPGEKQAITPVTGEQKDAAAEVSASPPKQTRKRVRTAKPSSKWTLPSGPTPYADFVPQNPTDAQGRTIYVAHDDTCYVQLPPKDDAKMLPPGVPRWAAGPVDCPEELDDPAWDDCSYGMVDAVKGKAECYCVQSAGNPPPPPAIIACPKHKK